MIEEFDTAIKLWHIDNAFITKNGTIKKNMLPEAKRLYPNIFKKTLELKSDYIQAESIINRIERDKLFTEFMSGQKQVIMTGDIEGVPIKIKIDSLHPDKIVDLKIMRDFEPIYKPEQGRLPWFEAWRYDLQGAVYQEVVRQKYRLTVTIPFFSGCYERKSNRH